MATSYSTGTVSISNGSTILTGVGTSWVVNGVQAGDVFEANGLTIEIASVASPTSITLARAWPGTTLSGNNYSIRFTPAATRVLTQTNALLAQLTNGILSSLSNIASPAANKLAYMTGAATWGLIDFKSWARTFLSAADLSAGRLALGVRDTLTANRNYYVRTDGSDSNNGLANTSGGAFRTINKAVNVLLALDCSTYNVTIFVGAGSYAENVELGGSVLGTGTYKITGDVTTPANCVTNYFRARYGANFTVEGFRVTAATGLYSQYPGSILTCGDISFAGTTAFNATDSGVITGNNRNFNFESTITIIANITGKGSVPLFGAGLTVNSNVWSAAGAFYMLTHGYCWLQSVTWTGTATGKRYTLATYAVLNTTGQATTWIPGSIAGTATDALYA